MLNLQIIPVTPFQQNCSIIWDQQKNAAIIDPGGEAEKLIQFIESQQLHLRAILLTHGHLDHVGAAVKLKTHFQVDIIGPHSADDYWLQGLPQQSEKFGLFECKAFTPDRWLDVEHEKITIGEMCFTVLHLPGHTPGHIGFIEQDKNIAFTGDVLFAGGIGRTDFPGGSYAQLIRSIKEKLFPLDDDMIIIAGHGDSTTIGREKQSNPYVRQK